MRLFSKLTLSAAGFLLLVSNAFGQGSGTTTLGVTVVSESSITVPATTTLTEVGGPGFKADYTGTTSLTYKLRTKTTGGTGSITLQITTDFGAGGPKVGSPAAGDSTTFTCASTLGTVCTGSQTALTASAVNVVTFGAGVHSALTGTAATVAWTITNDPAYLDGSYSAVATFTIANN